MSISRMRIGAITLAIAAAGVPSTAGAVAPAVLFMVKQIVQQAAQSMIKDALLSSLDGLGCKGMALSNAIAALDLRKGGAAAVLGATTGMAPMGALPPEAAAMMAQMTARLPPGMAPPMGLSMDQVMGQAMGPPLSPRDTLATIDELAELGFLPKPIQTELKQCMALVPAAAPALGMGLGMLKPVVPQLRQARDELRALSPSEQDEVAAAFVQEVKALPPDERAAFVEHLDSGFFPPRIATTVKRRLAIP
jgi:hypothetical protein